MNFEKMRITKKERVVLTLTLEGWMNKRIAAILNCSEKTIEHHQTALHEKFGVSCRAEMIAFAMKNGFGEEILSNNDEPSERRRRESSRKLEPEEFERRTGASPEAFSSMLSALDGKRGNSGRPAGLSLEDQLLLTLLRRRNHSSLKRLGEEFGISEATACRIIRRIENLLAEIGESLSSEMEPYIELCNKTKGNP